MACYAVLPRLEANASYYIIVGTMHVGGIFWRKVWYIYLVEDRIKNLTDRVMDNHKITLKTPSTKKAENIANTILPYDTLADSQNAVR